MLAPPTWRTRCVDGAVALAYTAFVALATAVIIGAQAEQTSKAVDQRFIVVRTGWNVLILRCVYFLNKKYVARRFALWALGKAIRLDGSKSEASTDGESFEYELRARASSNPIIEEISKDGGPGQGSEAVEPPEDHAAARSSESQQE